MSAFGSIFIQSFKALTAEHYIEHRALLSTVPTAGSRMVLIRTYSFQPFSPGTEGKDEELLLFSFTSCQPCFILSEKKN